MPTIDERRAELLKQGRDELRDLAGTRELEGRSRMSKEELADAIAAAEANDPHSTVTAVETVPASDVADATTDGQASVAGVVANAELGDELEPATPDEVGRPDLIELAQERAATRTPARVIGAAPDTDQED